MKVLFEILEKRCEINLSTIICPQREPSSLGSMILNDKISSNAIMKRATRHYMVMISQQPFAAAKRTLNIKPLQIPSRQEMKNAAVSLRIVILFMIG